MFFAIGVGAIIAVLYSRMIRGPAYNVNAIIKDNNSIYNII